MKSTSDESFYVCDDAVAAAWCIKEECDYHFFFAF